MWIEKEFSAKLIRRLCLQNIDTYDLEDYKYNFVNLTAFRLFDRRHSRVQLAMESFFAFKTMPNNEINRRSFTVSCLCSGDELTRRVSLDFGGVVDRCAVGFRLCL
jgi:hypothetical protein